MEEEKKENLELEKRKEKALNFLKNYKNYIQYIILAVIIWLSYRIRTANLPFLKDITTGKFIPADPDAMGILRYVYYIVEHGKLMAVDTLRYHPIGFTGLDEFSVFSHSIVYLYKFLHFFNPSITVEYADIIYPPIALAIGLVFFFLLVRKLFNPLVALISSAFLIVVPAFLFRTMAGVSDKEALGTMFMFMAFYFFIYSWEHKNWKKSLITSLLAGISTALMGLTWGGVGFVYLIIAIFTLTTLFINEFDKNKLYLYSIWLISSFIILNTSSSKFDIGTLITSLTTSVALFTLLLHIINYLIFDKRIINIKTKLPKAITSFIITLILVTIFLLIKQGPSFLTSKINGIFITLTKPFATSRWVITVAESHQPYLSDWFSQFGKGYIWLIIIGSIILFHAILEKLLKKETWKLSIVFTIFIFGLIFSRYSQGSIFNGETNISNVFYIGSMLLLALILIYAYLKTYYKNRDLFGRMNEIDEKLVFVLIWFVIMVIAARSAIRLIYIFAPITTIVFAYFVYKIYKWLLKIKENYIKYILVIMIIIIAIIMFTNFYKISSEQSKYSGTVYNQQWQVAMKWIRDSTQNNSVFAHWWDYGYLVQTGANRATLSDGGNARGAINYFMGRHVLTAQTNTEALELLKANEATHLLIVSDEIGKYPAFSSIGSDENYDRYSWISTFTLSDQKETRNGIAYIYQGGTALDEDLIYQGKLYPRRAAAIGAFMLEAQNVEENGTMIGVNFAQPKGVIVYNGQQVEVPINCIFLNNQELKFDNSEGIDACLRIIPIISENQQNPMGALLYLSPKVKRTLFTRLYLFNQEDEYFKVGYNDEGSMPLSIYNGRLIGPLKIWEINYPDNLNIPEEYYGTEVPNPEVNKVKSEYT